MATNNSYILNYKRKTWKGDRNEQNTNLQVNWKTNWKTAQLLIRT